MFRCFALVSAAISIAPHVAFADEPAPAAPPPSAPPVAPAPRPGGPGSGRIDLRLPVELTVTVFAAATWVISEIEKPSIGPAACRWCDSDADGHDSLNGFDRELRVALKWSSTRDADVASSVLGFGVAPVGALGGLIAAAAYDHHATNAPADALLVVESVALAIDVNQVAKFAAARERPEAHAGLVPDDTSRDENLSFFSGHSTLAFAIAASSGTIASMRHYRLAPVVWASGLAVAAATAYLRVAADKHYATDVLMGAAVGSAIGVAVPLLLHGPSRIVAGVGPTSSSGFGVSAGGVF